MPEFCVRWLEQYELIVEADSREEALDKAKDNISSGDHGEQLDTFDFQATPDEE